MMALCLLWPRTAWVMGPVWDQAPSTTPGAIPVFSKDSLRIARERYLDGDLGGVISILGPWLSTSQGPKGRTRDAAQLLLGTVHMELEHWNLASSSFYNVRKSSGPLASYGAWFEALMDHKRGRHLVAVKECKAYRDQWPDGPQADECLLLIGDAYAAEGARSASLGSYQEYLQRNPDTPRDEEIRLAIALAELRSRPERGIQALHRLALHHKYPSTDLAVQRELEALAEQGLETAIPSDPRSLRSRCESLRRSGQLEDAWELFQELARMGEEDEEMAEWVEENEERFALGTRNYDVYATHLEEKYQGRPGGDLAWQIFRAWGRAGQWDKAMDWVAISERDHASNWRWRQGKTEIAWATMLAGSYSEAAERWMTLSKRRGSQGRTARFYAGFCQIQAGSLVEALETLEPITAKDTHWQVAAFYWRAQARESLADPEGAQEDRDQVRIRDQRGWYTLLLDEARAQAAQGAATGPLHDGSWLGRSLTELRRDPLPASESTTTDERWTQAAPLLDEVELGGNALLSPEPGGDWSALSWDRLQQGSQVSHAPPALHQDLPPIGLEIPDGYARSTWFNPVRAEEEFYRFAEANKTLWPDLPAARDLALAGLYAHAVRLVYPIYEEWRDVQKNGARGDARRQQIASLGLGLSNWRPILCVVRDHYHAALAFTGLHRHVESDEDRITALRLSYPVVFGRELYELGQLYDVDPLLVLAIMRQESTYRNKALSPVGAIGLIQVMPSTGARVARLLEEERYSPGDLEEPMVNLRYGTYYLSRLLERFDGRYPMAVASYNGGPHNLSRWYRGKEGKIAMDVLVEQIMYDETRDYVKKVSGHYARYVMLYGQPGSRVQVPLSPAGDDRTVIDF
jgi:soluble lytic murein transglycosylase-like protein